MLRSMLMIGVIPLPALMNSSRRGSGSGSTKVPSTPPSRTIVPGFTRLKRNGETLPDSTSFGVIAMHPSRAPGIRRQRVGAPVMHAIDLDTQAQILPGTVAGHSQPGLISTDTALRRLALDTFDAPAQLARGPQRVDQLQVVVGQQRRGEGAHQAQHPAPALRHARDRTPFSHEGLYVGEHRS